MTTGSSCTAAARGVLFVAMALAACSGPSLTYRNVSQTLFPTLAVTSPSAASSAIGASAPPVVSAATGAVDPPALTMAAASPSVLPQLKDGEILYSLRTTNITLNPPGADPTKTVIPADACAGLAKQVAGDSRNCLNNVTVVPTPAAFSGAVFRVSGGSSNPFVTVKLSASPVSGQPLLLTSVTVIYNDNSAKVMTGIATGAAAGIPLGPIGIGIGAFVGGVGGAGLDFSGTIDLQNLTNIGKPQAPPAKPPAPALTRNLYLMLLCKRDATDWVANSIPSSLTLKLPVTVSLTPDSLSLNHDPLGYKTKETQPCWHALPVLPTGWASAPGSIAPQTSGWLYRIVAAEPPPSQFGTETIADFLTTIGDTTSPTSIDSLPVTPCQKASVELIWYADAEKSLEMTFAANPSPKVKDIRAANVIVPFAASLPFDVANPFYVQPIDAPKGGSLNFGPVCGGSISYQATATTVSDYASAAIAGANTYLQAEKSNSK